MPKAPRSEVGRRIYLIHKLNAVEDALRAIRSHLGPEWNALPIADRALLNDTLGEIWSATAGDTWESIHFARLTAEDLSQVVDVANGIRSGTVGEQEGMSTLIRVLVGIL